MRLRRRLSAIALAVLVALVAVTAVLATRPWSMPLFGGPSASGRPRPVRVLTGSAVDPLVRPVALAFRDRRLYVADAARGVIDVLSPGGHYYTSWGAGALVSPVALAFHPLSGDLYIVDRGANRIVVLDSRGRLRGVFAPAVPGVPWSRESTAAWAPLAIDFSEDGFAFVTDVLRRHRLLVIAPNGEFEAEALDVDGAGLAFPGAVKVVGNEVWVSDSNNQRVAVFDVACRPLDAIRIRHLPRGLALADTGDTGRTLLVADAMGHRIVGFDVATRREVLAFGTFGRDADQLRYPNAVATGIDDLVFIADTGNRRISVWRMPVMRDWFSTSPWRFSLYLVALAPLLALPWALRRPRYLLTADAVRELDALGIVDALSGVRARFECLPEDRAELDEAFASGGPVPTLFEPVAFSAPDARALMERFHLTEREAALLAAARGASALVTGDAALRQVATTLGIRALDAVEFATLLATEVGVREPNARSQG